jgi:tripartite-type tricarboxylate transporter receptor subunit TctC
MPDVPTAMELGVNAVSSTSRGFAVLKGTPEDRIARLEEGLMKAMSGPIFTSFLASTGQAPDSVASRAVWQAQLDEIHAESRSTLQMLGLLR